MKPLHENAHGGKDEKPESTNFPRVEHLRRLLGNDVLMLAWPRGSKGTKAKWGHLRVAAMADPKHLAKLEAGNIGIAQGQVSNGLCSIDLDDDQWMQRFLDANPSLASSLRTRGARGCNIWVQCVGDYPSTFKIKTDVGPEVGEWRATGVQTIISGRHPSGCHYRFIVEASPVAISFESIVWPDGLRRRLPNHDPSIAHSAHSSLSHAAHPDLSGSLKLPQVGSVCSLVLDVSHFIPSQRGESDRLLWAMAGRLKTAEKRTERTATPAEMTAIFMAWWEQASPFVDRDKDCAAYFAKWTGAYKRRKFPDDETALSAAWKAAQNEPLPPEATAEYAIPMSENMQRLVALCYQLQLFHGADPFFLGSRDAGPLLATPYRTVAYWLETLADEVGPFRVLKKVSTGSQASGKTNEYRYMPHEVRH